MSGAAVSRMGSNPLEGEVVNQKDQASRVLGGKLPGFSMNIGVKISFQTIITPFLAMMAVLSASAAPPDLTNGGVPGDTVTINLGPTGLRGWVYHVRADTSESRQIQIKKVSTGSPAAGIPAVDDVILGADGSGADPAEFTADARKSLALAIAEAEARTPAELKLLRWRAGTTSTLTLTLQTMGAYSATAPYICPKTAKILEQGLQYIMSSESTGRYSFGTLSLLAGYDPEKPNDSDNKARLSRAETAARALIPSAATRAQLMSNARDATSMITWQRGHTLVVLAEYYLVTGDSQVLPAIEAYAVSRTVTVTPSSGLTGTAVITVTVDDGNETSDQTFLVTATENCLSWATSHGVTGGPQGDSNHNGVPNLVEYALADGHERGVLSGDTLTFTKRGGDFGDDLSYVIETSIDLGVTDPWGPAESGVAETAVLIPYTFPSGNPVRQFARLKVIAVP